MPDSSENPLEPTEHGGPETVNESGQAAPGAEASAGEPLTEIASVEQNQELTGAWESDSGFVREGASGWEAPTVDSGGKPADPLLGARIRYLGDYELIDIIGQGGMGVVYRARQISLNRPVALKVVRVEGMPTDAELRRFQLEAEAVASLDHPGIVPIYEIGTHGGRHYFSMKLISGESLAKAAPRLKGNYEAIAQILAGSAEAVQHAHERGILHRDIKPANIVLDGDDIPHVTDFGLAKRLDPDQADLTLSTAVVGTPAYMAPEQTTATRGTITIATDIYGLGAVLYALLSGHAPHRGSSVLEVLDAVREKMPESPRKVDAKIPRDLEVICMKCMDRDPRRRYHSAGELADDLNRWLDGRPITARKVSGATRVILWGKRNPLVAGLAAALLISVLVGSAIMVSDWRELRRQRDELVRSNRQIRAEWQASRSLNEFLVTDMLAWSSPFLAGRKDVPISALLDRSASLASTRFANQPKIEGSIRQILGHAYLALGMLDRAEAELLRSSRLRQSLPEADELDRLSAEFLLAYLRLSKGDLEEAETHALKAVNGRRQLLGETDEATLEAEELLGAIMKLRGRDQEARERLEKLAETTRRFLGDEHRVTLHARIDLAIIAHDQGRLDEAFTNLQEITEICTRLYGTDHPETLLVKSKLGATRFAQGNEPRVQKLLDEAEKILDECLDPAREVLGAGHPETMRIMNNLAAVRCTLGKFEAAVEQFQEIVHQQRIILPPDHQDLFTSEVNLAVALLRMSQPAKAEPALRDLIPRMRRSLRGDDRTLGNAIAVHAGALLDLKKPEEAENLNVEAIAILRKTMPSDHPRIIDVEGTQAMVLLANGKEIEAEKLARKVVDFRSKPEAKEAPWRIGIMKVVIGASLASQKKFEEAATPLLEGFQAVESDPSAPKKRVSESLERVIQFYDSWGKADEVARWRARRVATAGS